MNNSPRDYIHRLCRYISDDSTVAVQANAYWGGTGWTAARVAKLRGEMKKPKLPKERAEPKTRGRDQSNYEENMRRGSERLLNAIMRARSPSWVDSPASLSTGRGVPQIS
jgi:hypothetical protein